ncbi:hypothetical protein [Burkholderia gladioli]|nr:hypothetical protein [Burkholderia gladioli]
MNYLAVGRMVAGAFAIVILMSFTGNAISIINFLLLNRASV